MLVIHLTPVVGKELASLVSQWLALVLIITTSVLVNQQRTRLTLGVGKAVRIKERSLTYMQMMR